MSLDIGLLRERVTVQQAVETTNALGETIHTWEEFATVWASVDGVTSREALYAGQARVAITHKVRLRWLPGLNHHMRFLWQNRILEIVSLLEHEVRTIHEAICQENIP